MRITRVELTNIKSYQHAVIPFQPGTIAVRGLNGAGKSTLVEAIGYALFDALSYNRAQFVREGEKSGQIVVAFISALDDREYEVVRRVGSASEWYVVDPELHDRLVDQSADVIDFLRDHLRIEGDVKLETFFNDALGVPQGTFTADFLMTPANRKKKFDVLLQVEDYRKAAEKLNDTNNYLKQEHIAQEYRIERLEAETGKLEGWRELLRQRHLQVRWLVDEIERLHQQIVNQQERRAQLQRLEAEVKRLENAVAHANDVRRNAAARLEDATARRDEALTAQRILAQTGADHQAYLQAERQSLAARDRQRQRDDLRSKQAELERRRERAQSEEEHARQALAQAEAAAQRIETLQPLIARQTKLESERDQALQDARRLRDLDDALAKMGHEHATAQQEITAKEQA
ncbi:MAG: SMC family ATPase, partial [Ktedonobacterales bacterium]